MERRSLQARDVHFVRERRASGGAPAVGTAPAAWPAARDASVRDGEGVVACYDAPGFTGRPDRKPEW